MGTISISQHWVEQREKIAHLFYPNSQSNVGLDQLIRAYKQVEIMKLHGHFISDQALEQESNRIDTETRDPKTLQKIKDIFLDKKTGKKDYLQVFVLPTYVDRVFYYDFFLNSAEIQQEQKQEADLFFKAIQNKPEDLVKIAQTEKRPVLSIELDLSSGLKMQTLNKKKPSSQTTPLIDNSPRSEEEIKTRKELELNQEKQGIELAKLWHQEIIQNTPPNKIFKNLVNWGDSWLVVRNEGQKKKASNKTIETLTAVQIKKKDFSSWLNSEQLKIQVLKP